MKNENHRPSFYRPFSGRFTQAFSSSLYAMASASYVKSPEPEDPELDHIWRYSASPYSDHKLKNGWRVHKTLIWGLVNGYDGASALNSFVHEFWLHNERCSFGGISAEPNKASG